MRLHVFRIVSYEICAVLPEGDENKIVIREEEIFSPKLFKFVLGIKQPQYLSKYILSTNLRNCPDFFVKIDRVVLFQLINTLN